MGDKRDRYRAARDARYRVARERMRFLRWRQRHGAPDPAADTAEIAAAVAAGRVRVVPSAYRGEAAPAAKSLRTCNRAI